MRWRLMSKPQQPTQRRLKQHKSTLSSSIHPAVGTRWFIKTIPSTERHKPVQWAPAGSKPYKVLVAPRHWIPGILLAACVRRNTRHKASRFHRFIGCTRTASSIRVQEWQDYRKQNKSIRLQHRPKASVAQRRLSTQNSIVLPISRSSTTNSRIQEAAHPSLTPTSNSSTRVRPCWGIWKAETQSNREKAGQRSWQARSTVSPRFWTIRTRAKAAWSSVLWPIRPKERLVSARSLPPQTQTWGCSRPSKNSRRTSLRRSSSWRSRTKSSSSRSKYSTGKVTSSATVTTQARTIPGQCSIPPGNNRGEYRLTPWKVQTLPCSRTIRHFANSPMNSTRWLIQISRVDDHNLARIVPKKSARDLLHKMLSKRPSKWPSIYLAR